MEQQGIGNKGAGQSRDIISTNCQLNQPDPPSLKNLQTRTKAEITASINDYPPPNFEYDFEKREPGLVGARKRALDPCSSYLSGDTTKPDFDLIRKMSEKRTEWKDRLRQATAVEAEARHVWKDGMTHEIRWELITKYEKQLYETDIALVQEEYDRAVAERVKGNPKVTKDSDMQLEQRKVSDKQVEQHKEPKSPTTSTGEAGFLKLL